MTDATKLLLDVVLTDYLKPNGGDADAALSKLHQILDGSRRHEAEQAAAVEGNVFVPDDEPDDAGYSY